MSTWVAKLAKHLSAQLRSYKHLSLKYLKSDRRNSIWNLKAFQSKAATRTASLTYLLTAKSTRGNNNPK